MSPHNTHAIRTPKTATLRRGMTRSAIGLAGGALVATGMLATGGAANAAGGWDSVAACESSGDWSANTGNGYYGGLQFSQQTWDAFGGSQYASSADQASKSQQIATAEKVLAQQGKGAWPTCGVSLTGGADTSSAPSADNSSSTSSRKADQKADRSSERKPAEKQGDWSCNGDGIADNCDDNGFTKKTEQKQQEAPKQTEQKQQEAPKQQAQKPAAPAEKQGDWSCDGDGIADNCDDNGFTKKTEQKQQAEKPAAQPEAPKQSDAGSHATADLSVAGTLDVDGTMGTDTVTALQDWLGVDQTGEMNEETTLALQAWANTDQDGTIGEDTVAGLQHEVGATQNGSDEIDGDTVEVVQTFLNLY
ncbi:transglycosylase family protein [Brachybacterium sp. 107]|uniref:transglycosylase family protein n=1 Tax=Brachybacterium sp. 107 TaxID=3457736 RepID=UPI00403427BF